MTANVNDTEATTTVAENGTITLTVSGQELTLQAGDVTAVTTALLAARKDAYAVTRGAAKAARTAEKAERAAERLAKAEATAKAAADRVAKLKAATA